MQTAAEDLAQQAGRVPGRARVVFQTVADVALIGTVLVSGALAAVHLYRALFPRHKEEHAVAEPAAHDNREPPRHRHRAVATGDDADGRGRSRGG